MSRTEQQAARAAAGPSSGQTSDQTTAQTTSQTTGRLKLLALIAAFGAPLLLAIVMFAAPHFAPAPVSHGQLIVPPRPLYADGAVGSSPQASSVRPLYADEDSAAGALPQTSSARPLYADGNSAAGSSPQAPSARPRDADEDRAASSPPKASFTRLWTLALPAAGDCDLYCETALFIMRQTRMSLGRERSRVRLVYLRTAPAQQAGRQAGRRSDEQAGASGVTARNEISGDARNKTSTAARSEVSNDARNEPGGELAPELAQLLPLHPQLEVVPVGADAAAAFDAEHSGVFFLVDPLGNVMMRYSRETSSAGLLKDLKKLLKASRIG